MKAAQIVAPRQIEMIDTDKPDISSDPEGAVLIKTQMNAICGTDMPWFAMEQSSVGLSAVAGDDHPRMYRSDCCK